MMRNKKILFISFEFIYLLISLFIYFITSKKIDLFILYFFVSFIFRFIIYLFLYDKVNTKKNVVFFFVLQIIINLFLYIQYIDLLNNRKMIIIPNMLLYNYIVYSYIIKKYGFILSHENYMKILYILPKKIGHSILYKKIYKKNLDIKNPKTFDEKLHWLMINYYGKKEAKLTDKEQVKKYINNLNLPELNVPKTYFIINSKKENYKFPKKYVLKVNHGSGDVFVCNESKSFDYNQAITKLEKLKKKNYALNWLEYHYKYISPIIMCEEFLDEGNGKRPIDYKFMCFDGNVDSILICSNRDEGLKLDFYNTDWKYIDYVKEEYRSGVKMKKPKKLEKMIEIASKISKGFPFVRVDLYDIKGKIYFGEMTFTPAAGFNFYYNDKFQIELGRKIDINKLR